MPKPTGAQIIGALLRAGGRGIGQYYDYKQLEEQKKLRAEDREWMKTVRGWRKEDRTRDIAQEKREQQVKQQAQSFLKILSGDSPYAPEIPDVNIQRQKAYDTIGRTAPEDVKFGAKREGLTRAGLTQEQVLKKLGIAPKAEKTARQKEEEKLWQTLTTEQKIQKLFGIKPPDTAGEAKKQRAKLKSDQKKWDKDAKAHVLRNVEMYPQTANLLAETGRFSIGYRLKPENWSDKNWNLYKFEQVRISRFMGARPGVKPEVPVELREFFD